MFKVIILLVCYFLFLNVFFYIFFIEAVDVTMNLFLFNVGTVVKVVRNET